MKKLKVLLIMAVMSTSIMSCGSKEVSTDSNKDVKQETNSEDDAIEDNDSNESDNENTDEETNDAEDIEAQLEDDETEILNDDGDIDQIIYDFDNAEACIYIPYTFMSACENKWLGLEAGNEYNLPDFNDAILSLSELKDASLVSFGIFKIDNLASDLNGYCFEYDFINENDESIELFLVTHVDCGALYLDMAVRNNDKQEFELTKNGVLFLNTTEENGNIKEEVYAPNDNFEYDFIYSDQTAYAGSSIYQYDEDGYTNNNEISKMLSDMEALNDEDASIDEYLFNGLYIYDSDNSLEEYLDNGIFIYDYSYGNEDSNEKILKLAEKYNIEFKSFDEIYEMQNNILKHYNLDMDKIYENIFNYDNYIIYRDLTEY